MENIDWKHLLFEFDGRINRGKFWAGIAAVWAISIVLWILIGIAVAVNSAAIWVILGILAIAVYVGIFWMGLAVSIKRWHDRGKSGWWVFIALVPLIGGLWALIETGFLEGDSGPNEYGPDPLTS